MFRILLVDDEAQERDGIRFLIEKSISCRLRWWRRRTGRRRWSI